MSDERNSNADSKTQAERIRELEAENERLRAELADKNELLTLLEASLDGIWDWSIQTGDDYLSPRWKQMLGYSPNELENNVDTWRSLLAPGEFERGLAAVETHWETGAPYDIVLEYRRKDGTSAWMQARGKAVAGPDGEWTRMAGTHTDVTGLRRAAEQERKKLEIVLSGLSAGIVVAEPSGKFRLYNRAAAELTGLERPDLEIPNWSAEYGTFREDATTVYPAEELPLARALRGESVDDARMVLRNPGLDGERWLSVSARPLENGDAVAVFTDVTTSVAAQTALERSNEDLARFAYIASHDLQEPLRKITSFCGLLKDDYGDKLDETGHEYIEFAIDGSKRLKQLIEDLLNYSKVERAATNMGRVDSQLLVEDVRYDLKDVIATSGATIHARDLPTVVGDESRLRQLFTQLVSNAIRFRGERPPRIQFSASRVGKNWDFQIADNGIGIAERHQQRIFKVFERLHPRSEYPGSGIGLALCQRIIESHRGTIEVRESSDSGTIVAFTLPIEPS